MSCLIKGLSRRLQLSITQARSAFINPRSSIIQAQPGCSLKFYSIDSIAEQYQQRLLERAKEKGFESVQALLEDSKEDIQKKKKNFNKIDPLKELEDYEQRIKMSTNLSGLTKGKGPIDPNQSGAPFKTLNSFLNYEKIKELSKQEVEFLWRAKWLNKENVLCAVVPVNVFDKLMLTAKSNPVFVLPLPREISAEANGENKDQGIELHYIQWQFVGPHTTHCIITSLAEYKLHKEYAKPHTVFQFHSEMANDKKVIFMNGTVEPGTNVSVQDAQLLLLNVQRFYGAMGEETPIAKRRVQLLRDFTTGSPNFNVDLLISLAQSMEN